jgi:BlaI family transcriptional regulator, penicillinase repressor
MKKRAKSGVVPGNDLGRRERQIMDIIVRLGQATALEVLNNLPDPPSYSAVRGMLRYLEDKGHLRHEEDGPRYVYFQTVPAGKLRASALTHLVRTFFGGSTSEAAASLIESKPLSAAEYERLSQILENAKKTGRKLD